MLKSERARYGNKGNLGQIRRFATFGSSISRVQFSTISRPVVESLIPVSNYRHIRVEGR